MNRPEAGGEAERATSAPAPPRTTERLPEPEPVSGVDLGARWCWRAPFRTRFRTGRITPSPTRSNEDRAGRRRDASDRPPIGLPCSATSDSGLVPGGGGSATRLGFLRRRIGAGRSATIVPRPGPAGAARRRFFRHPTGRWPFVGAHAASRHRPRFGRSAPGGSQPSAEGPRHEARPGSPSQQSGSPGGGAGFQPLKPSDYMSSAGIRPMTPRVGPSSTSSSASATQRRPVGESAPDGGRRDRDRDRESNRSAARPLPAVASGPVAPTQRQGGSQRPAPSSPASKTQRPEKSMTKEEMLNWMRSGQLPSLHTPGLGGARALGGGQAPRYGPDHAWDWSQSRPGSAYGASARRPRPATARRPRPRHAPAAGHRSPHRR